jgi:hypothetical protein
MKKFLLNAFAFSCLGILLFQNEVSAQCSGGALGTGITPTTTTQTVTVPNAGLYYTFSGIAGVTYQFSFCPADGGSASYDTQITMLDNTGAYAGGYNDDWCGLQSYLQWVCPSNGTFRALVSRYYCNQNGGTPATLAYKLLPPPNDLCSGATSVNDPSVTVGNTTYANPDVAPACTTTDGTGGGVWFTVMGDGSQMTASLCGSSFDTRIRIYSGNCSGLICEAGNDDFCGLQSQASWCSVNGTTYYILVHGNGAAAGDFTLTMSETAVTPPTVSQSGTSYCGSGSITITASGSSSYNWSPPAGLNTTTGPTVIASPSVTTTYTVTITDAATGCPAYANATVTVFPIPVVTAANNSGTICAGQNANLNAGGASTYNWMPGNLNGSAVTVNPMTTTTYTVTGTSTDGCTNTATVTVNVNALPVVTASAASPSICTGTFTTLTATGASSYQWQPGFMNGPSVNVAPTTTTTYTVTGTASTGCTDTSSVTVTVNPLPTITATAVSDTVCQATNDTLTASGGVTYLWSNSSTNNPTVITPNSTTTYTVTGTDANGCSSNANVSVTVLPAPAVNITSNVPSICGGGNATLTATGEPVYNWMPGNLSGSSITVSPATTTTYTVNGTAVNGCIRTDSITVGVYPVPTVTSTSSNPAFCNGGNTTLAAIGASTYAWSPGNLTGDSITVAPNSTLSYTVTGTDTNGCTNTSVQLVTVYPLPTVNATASSSPVCQGSTTTLIGTGATTYVWQPGNLNGSSVTVTPATTTNYTVTGTDANGCTNTYIIGVSVLPPPNLIVYSSLTVCCKNDAAVFLTGIPGGGTWSGTAVVGSTFSPPVAGIGVHVCTYTYIDQYGCTNTATVSITVNDCVGITEAQDNDGISFYPNPNNGNFTVGVASDNVREMKMEIIDLQGRLIYAEQIGGISSGFSKEINLTGIADGAYYVRFTSENNIHTEKLIIQR